MDKSTSRKTLPFLVSSGKYYLLLFVLWPFLAFLIALKNYRQKEAKTVVYMFLIYFGLTFVLSGTNTDSERYAMYLIENAKLPFSEFFNIVGGLYTSDTSVDIVEPFISFMVSRFTSDSSILFAVFAAIFGFFYLKSIDLLHDHYVEKPSWNAFIFMAFFTMILPITTINGFRMWTAAWVFFLGAYHVVLNKDSKYLILALSASLVHWSFLSANAILIIYYFSGNRNLIYIPITIASFILPQFLSGFFGILSLRFGGSIQNRYDGYSNEEYILGRQDAVESSVWFMQLGTELIFYFLIIAIIIIQIRARAIEKTKEEENLFSFLLLFLAFVNFGSAIPSFGSRFQLVFLLFASLYVFMYFLKVQMKSISLLTLVGLFPLLLYAAITFRIGADSINAWALAPGLGLPLFVGDLSISEFLF